MRLAGLFIFLFLITGIFSLRAQEKLLGSKWYTPEKDAKIKFYKKNDEYFGKIVWLEEPYNDQGELKKDTENPDPEKRDRTIKGLELFKGFEYDGDNEWDDGTVYDAKSGDTYSCEMWLEDNNTLKVRGYIGISWIGRTETFTRAE